MTEGVVLPERERRFLGCIRLSLAALYQAEVMDGVFKVRWGAQGSHQLWPAVTCQPGTVLDCRLNQPLDTRNHQTLLF